MNPSPALLSTTPTSCTGNPCSANGRSRVAERPCRAAEPARALLLVVAAVPPVMPAAAPAAALMSATPAVMIHRLFIAKAPLLGARSLRDDPKSCVWATYELRRSHAGARRHGCL